MNHGLKLAGKRSLIDGGNHGLGLQRTLVERVEGIALVTPLSATVRRKGDLHCRAADGADQPAHGELPRDHPLHPQRLPRAMHGFSSRTQSAGSPSHTGFRALSDRPNTGQRWRHHLPSKPEHQGEEVP